MKYGQLFVAVASSYLRVPCRFPLFWSPLSFAGVWTMPANAIAIIANVEGLSYRSKER